MSLPEKSLSIDSTKNPNIHPPTLLLLSTIDGEYIDYCTNE